MDAFENKKQREKERNRHEKGIGSVIDNDRDA